MTRVLVTGGSGQIGTALAGAGWQPGVTLLRPPRAVLDLADAGGIARWIAHERPDAVVNCAAFTAVDRAETEVAAAWAVNAIAPAALAAATARIGVPMVQISTDYVFDGSAGPYAEDDAVAPLGVYGASKLAGEIAVRAANPRALILRTAWVVSSTGANFVRTMLRLAREPAPVRVVADQLGCPTGADDIAAAIITVTERLIADPAAATGVYHFAGAGSASWHDVAGAVFATAAAAGIAVPPLHAIATSEYPTPARRPADSRFLTGRITAEYGVTPPPWRPAVERVARTLIAAAGNALEPNR